MMQETIIKIDSLNKRFGRKQAVKDLSFEVNKGDLFGFLGPNGAGKSTTLYMLMGLVYPSSGTMEIFGKPIKNLIDIQSRMGSLIEDPSFYPNLSAEKNLELSARMLGSLAIRSIPEVLEKTGLKSAAKIKVGKFSSGMKQRLGIARAILGSPELLVLDEPTNGLDPEASEITWRILRDFTASGKGTVLVSSHLLYEIEEYCNRVCVIHEGQCLCCGRVEDLLQSKNRPIEIVCEDPDSFIRLQKIASRESWIQTIGDDSPKGFRMRVFCTEGSPADLNLFLSKNNIRVEQFNPMRQTLKDFFLSLTAQNKNKNGWEDYVKTCKP
jgi:ABC-type multidrug transport system ATPase subunit